MDSVVERIPIDSFHVNYYIKSTFYGYVGMSSLPATYSLFVHYDTLHTDTSAFFTMDLLPEEDTLEYFGYANNDFLYYYYPDDSSGCFKSPKYHKVFNPVLLYETGNPDTLIKSGFEMLHYTFFQTDPGGLPCGFIYIASSYDTNFYSYKSVIPSISCGTMDPLQIDAINSYNNTLLFSPNPATTTLTINTSFINSYTFTLYNILGQAVLQTRSVLPQQTIDVSHLPDGIYEVVVQDEGGNRYYDKVVITH